MGTEFQFCKMKKVLQIGCNVLMYLTLLTCTLKMAKVRSFMLCIFYRDLKKRKRKKPDCFRQPRQKGREGKD